MIRVLLVDDQALLRTGFRLVLEAVEDIEVVGEAGDGAAAEQMARALEPDVILMDVRMPGRNGIEATQAITQALPSTRVLILTTFDLDEYAFAGLRAGASGFLLKDTKPADLIEVIRVVASGDAVVSPRITRRMLELFSDRLPEVAGGTDGGVAAELACLTPRELEVLTLIGQGLSNAEIAATLVVSEATVKTHVGNVLAKTGSRDRVQAVVLAHATGLVGPGA
ncbi:LuxR family two component transcriptional regulator [Salana multivorans]|uniref:LuxR family two component transcriptional regulator n=1 Tax=Salana multivorans TaxID=120377 RepID=A0A3N2D7V2_9MICO|nr:response regulator transcription factor [Salana multivorans]ROR95845.1 LuxR family two component transcriptional regulator [Salana multivorans]